MIITYAFLGIFLLMIVYLVYFQVFKSDSYINSSYNSRQDLYAEHVTRGNIETADGQVIATTVTDSEGNDVRSYPFSNMFAHVAGYVNNGKGGLESSYNNYLLRSHSFLLLQVIQDLKGEKSQGDTLITTLDYDVQEAAYNALGSNNGAVVVLEASTGKVLAMVSKPDFDPNTLAYQWDDIVNDDSSSVLLNRVTQGLYPPGSTFKMMTVLEYIHENANYNDYWFECQGTLTEGNDEIHCYHNSVHGEENLADSFANSCNTSFANIGLSLNINKFNSLCEEMLFNTKLPGSISCKQSVFSLNSTDNTGLIMQTAIGQGDTMVTPMHMALLAEAVDNGGVVMSPYLVERIENDAGVEVKSYSSKEYGSIMSESDAAILQEYMSEVVQRGTGTALSGQSYNACGKTGSAEYDSAGDSHGWFVGYGSKEGYSDIAIAVIVEDGDSGSKSAVPVAKSVFDVYFNQ